ALVDEFRTAVNIRLMSEVPLGAFLSGGLDSSGVVAMMSKILDRPVKTATIGFNEKQFDESKFGREVSQHLGTEHHERVVTAEKTTKIKNIAWLYDDPFADSSALPSSFVSRVACERVTVALRGEGGDENFAGYTLYFRVSGENRPRSLPPAGIRKSIIR